VFDDATAVQADEVERRRLAEELAARCDGLAPLNPGRLDARDAPAGEILATKTGSNEIHRFRPDGTDLGRLELPGVVGPINGLTAMSPGHPGDSGQIRVIVAGADGSRMGVVTPPGHSRAEMGAGWRPVVLTSSRGGWCPGSTVALAFDGGAAR
jgi:hypothetical protein